MTRDIRSMRLAWAAAALLLGASVLWADSKIDIQCVDASGNAVSGARVVLQSFGGKPREQKSDGKGKASFSKIEDGVFRIVGRKEGFDPTLHEFLVLKGSGAQNVTLQFKAGDLQKQLYFENQAQQQKSIELLNQGVQAMQAGKFVDAEKPIQQSIELYPSNPDGFFNLAIAYLQQQKWEQGEEALKKASQISTVLAELPTTGGAANPYKEMIQRVQDIQSKLPGLKQRSVADKLLADKRFDEAAVKYREILQASPEKDPDLLYNLAIALGNARKYDDAIAALDQGIQLKPTEKAYQDLKKQLIDFKQNAVLIEGQKGLDEGKKLYDAGDYAGALKKFEALLPTIPEKNQGAIWYQIAVTLAQLKQPDKAITAFKKAMELSPTSAEYRKTLAQYYLNEKRYQDALELYADPKSAGSQPLDQVLFALGEKLSSQGNSEVAQLAFERALAANASHAEAHYELGMLLYYGKKNDKRARDLLTKYVAMTDAKKDHVDNAKTVLVVIKKRSP
jgi:tetratricopeptide (TPR) repeat protein